MFGIRFWQVLSILMLLALVGVLLLRSPLRQQPEDIPRAVSLPPIGYDIVGFDALPGWQADNHKAALAPFLRSCAALLVRDPSASANPVEYIGEDQPLSFAGTVADWRAPCEAALALQAQPDVSINAARQFFEDYFTPLHIKQPDAGAPGGPVMTDEGLFTGYFEPIFPASRERTEEHSVPVLTRPLDLVTADLSAFRPELAGTLIAGRIVNGSLVPYDTHAEINRKKLDADVLAWINPNDLLFMQIQGSGRLSFGDETMRVGYSAPNGHVYTAIGRELVEMGEIPLEEISMQSIYEWLESAPPVEAARVREVNKSYIFFRRLEALPDPTLGPLGAQGVQLTDNRSLAVDRRYHALGAPVWVNLQADENNEYPLQRLFIAQDTGGAIRGAVRGDIYIGSGRDAGGEAGRFRRMGSLYTLLPKTVVERLEADGAQKTSIDA